MRAWERKTTFVSISDFMRIEFARELTCAEWLASPHGMKTWRRLQFDRKNTKELVYFIQAGDRPEVKIGFTKRDRLYHRVAGIQTGNASRLHVRALMPGGKSEEQWQHEMFSEWHIRGEWFRLVPEMIGTIKAINYAFGFCMSCARIHFRPKQSDDTEFDCVRLGFIAADQPREVFI